MTPDCKEGSPVQSGRGLCKSPANWCFCKILGVNTESLALTVVAVVASLALALAVWLGRWPGPLLLLVAGFGLVFAAGDVRELVHQLDESNAGVAAIAAILIGLHLLVAAIALALLARRADASSQAAPKPAS